MPEHDDVRVAGDDADAVLERLALRRARELLGVVRAHGPAAEAQHGGLEREPGARRGLVEQRRHDASQQPAGGAVGIVAHLVGAHEDLVEELTGELLRLDDMSQAGADGHEKTSFPDSQDRT